MVWSSFAWSRPAVSQLGVCALVFAVALVGCSEDRTIAPDATGAPTAKEALDDLVNLLNYVKMEGKQPPARAADLQPIEPIFLNACLGITRGEIVYVWGTTIDPTGAGKVLAYEKAVETGSGYVLMQDGTVKTMPTSEFQALPKATK
jgi:hypothetical protein